MFKRLLSADERALAAIIEKYGPQVKSQVLKWLPDAALAQELVQDVFLELWKNREQVARLKNPTGWLYTVAKYKAIDSIRASLKRRTYRLCDNEDSCGCLAAEPGIKEEEYELLQKLLEAGLKEISERQRQALLLFSKRNQTIEEIAREMGTSSYSVKTYLARARSYLRQYLKKHWLLIFLLTISCI